MDLERVWKISRVVLRRGEAAGCVARRSKIHEGYSPFSRLAIGPAALAIPSPGYFPNTLLRFRSVANRKVLKSGAVANCKPMCALWLESFAARNKLKEKRRMLYTIALVLIIAWLLGIVSSYTLGGFIYILLVVAILDYDN